MIRSIQTQCLALLVAVACLMPATPSVAATLPDALNLVPKGAQVVVIAPSLSSLRKKIDDFAASLGLKNMPGYVNPIDELKRELNVKDGFNEKGSALIVISNLKASIEDGSEPDVLVAVPVSDYSKFIAQYNPAKDGDIDSFDAGGETIFSRGDGKHCLLSPSRKLVAGFKAGNGAEAMGKAAGTLGTKYLSTSDVAVYVDVESIAPILRSKLDEGYKDMSDLFDSLGQGDQSQAQMMKVTKAIMAMFLEGIDNVLRDTNAAVIGGDLDSKGIGFTMTAQFRDGSQLAKIFPGGGNAANLLAKLPSEPYMFAAAMDFSGIKIEKIATAITKAMPKDGGWMSDMITQSLPLLAKAKGMAQVYQVPQNAAGILGGFGGLTVTETADADEYLAAQKKYVESMNNLKMDLGPDPDDNPMVMTFASKYDKGAVKIDGVSVDQYQIKMNMPPALLRQMGPMAGVMMGMGLTNQSGYVAKSGNYVLMTTLADTNLVKSGLAAIKAGKGLGSDGPTAMTRKTGLDSNSAVEFYLSVGGIIKTVQPLLAMVAPNGPQIQVPNNLPPIAMGMSAKDSGVAMRVYAPMPLIQWVKDFAMQMQGGGQGGNNAQPAPF